MLKNPLKNRKSLPKRRPRRLLQLRKQQRKVKRRKYNQRLIKLRNE